MLLNSFICPDCETPFPILMGSSRCFFGEGIFSKRRYECTNCGTVSVSKVCWRDALWAWPLTVFLFACLMVVWDRAAMAFSMPFALRLALMVIAVLLVCVGVRRGSRLVTLAHDGPAPSTAVRRSRWTIRLVVGLAIAMPIYVGFDTYVIKTDVLAPQIPRGSRVLVFTLARGLDPGDVIVYRGGKKNLLARVVGLDETAKLVRVERKGEPVRTVDRSQVLGKSLMRLW